MKYCIFTFLAFITMLSSSLNSYAMTVTGNYTNAESSQSQPTLRIHKSWIDLNVERNGTKGTVVHIKMEAIGYKGKNMTVTAFLDCPKGTGVKDTNGKYKNHEGNVCTWIDLNNIPYDHAVWDDLNFFLPNEEVHPIAGKHEYFLHTFVFCDGKILGSIWSGSFLMEGAQQSGNNHQQQSGGGRIVKGRGYFGKGQDIHVMAPENINHIGRDKRTLYYCNGGCSPVKITMNYYEPAVADPNNPFIVNMANNLRGWSFNCEFPGSGSTFVNGISDYTYEEGMFTFKARNGIVVRLASDLSYLILQAGPFGSVKYEYRIPESDYNRFAVLQKNFLKLAAMYQAVEERTSNSSSGHGSNSRHSSSGNGNNRGVRYIVYRPNYTFPVPEVWCSECNDYDFPHDHVWRR